MGLLSLLASLEALAPRRARAQPRSKRWVTNWGVTILNTLTLRALAFALRLLAVGAAMDAASQGWGLFNIVGLPIWIEVVMCILILDFVIWVQHLITHKVPLLWRLHRVHHADVDMDVTTAIRFHPIEIALSMLLKIGVLYLLGPAALAVILFEIILNCSAMFNHANIRLPVARGCALFGGFWSRRICTACIILCTAMNMTATTALPCRSGIRCFALTSRNLRKGMTT